MEDEIYETGPLNVWQVENMKAFLDEEIGTDYDVDNPNENVFHIMVFDLTPKEVKLIRNFEENRLDEQYEKFCVVFGDKSNSRPMRSEFIDDYFKAEELLESLNSHFVDKNGERALWAHVETSRLSQQYQRLNGAYPVRDALNIDSEEAIKKGGPDFIGRVERAMIRTYYLSEMYEERGEIRGGEIYELNGLLGYGYEHEIYKFDAYHLEDGFLRHCEDYESMFHYLQNQMDFKFIDELYSCEEMALDALEKEIEIYEEDRGSRQEPSKVIAEAIEDKTPKVGQQLD